MKKGIAILGIAVGLSVIGSASAGPTIASVTADERAAIKRLQDKIQGNYGKIAQNHRDIWGRLGANARLFAEIRDIKGKIAGQKAELVQDLLCAIQLRASQEKHTALKTRVDRAQSEVAQDQKELESTKKIADAQAALCATKEKNKEDAKEIASCKATAAILAGNVAKEQKDMGEAQARLNAARADLGKFSLSNLKCRVALAENGGTTNLAKATSDERAAIKRLNDELAKKYNQVKANTAAIQAEFADNTKLSNEINAWKAEIARQRKEAIGDALCLIQLKWSEGQHNNLKTRAERAKTEVAQDQNELEATKKIAAAQSGLCDTKVKNKENASEIASCRATAAILNGNVAKEQKDLGESQKRLADANKALGAFRMSQLKCQIAIRN